ncbi:nitrilase-related carbon-nitrogen hydrolase [Thiomicrorhabdus sp. Milos-T2]|uniref:nitrilase-related carbon-nitrogen hydrolase n=1 Tax=Thiomicrorhabdus sp. Milos-T2 TaxID=90814 RepID=UPI000493C363|nr:nitrilase-related carbon-nitrogen hydrolase [Thiomicrorhabdus sp. Milos-T2]
MKILAIQWNPVWQNSAENLIKLEQTFAEQLTDKTKNIDLVVLPETFHSGFSMQAEQYAESVDGKVSQKLSELAKTYSVAIIAGVAQKQVRAGCHGQQARFYNRALAFNREGQQIGSYSKQKLFSYANEQHSFIAGHQPEIVQLNGEPFALFICYDLRFPELFREVASQVKGMIIIANWPQSRQQHWETLLKARAIENQCFVIGVNRIGQDGNGLNYIGGSSVISPLGEVLAYANEQQEWLNVEIDLQQVNEVRKQFPFLEDCHI